MKDPVYFVQAHGEDAQAVHFGNEIGKAVFIVPNRADHDPSKTVSINTMASFDAYHVAKAFVDFWEGRR